MYVSSSISNHFGLMVRQPEDAAAREMLVDLCGPQYADTPICCTSDQIKTLRDNLGRAELMIASCPACKNNFRDFFCAFTCHPDQGAFKFT